MFPSKKTNELLVERSIEFEELAETKLLDNNGVLRSALLLDGFAPLPADYFNDGKSLFRVGGKEDLNMAGLLSYENSGMVQGEYLIAMSTKYRKTRECAALASARRTAVALLKNYEMSQEVAPGFFCKPWGNRLSDETSSDQCLFAVYSLDDYYELADEAEKKKIRQMICGIAGFWKNCNYHYKYFGYPLNWQKCRFLVFMHLAFKYSGEKEFADEFARLESLPEVREDIPFRCSLRIKGTREERWRDQIGDCYVRWVGSENLPAVMSLFPLLSENPAVYRDKLKEILDICQLALDEYSNFHCWLTINPKNGTVKILDKLLEYTENQQLKFKNAIGPYLGGGMASCSFAASLAETLSLFPENRQLLERILQDIDAGRLTWFEDPYDIFQPEIKWRTQIFSGDALCSWLWAYWRNK